MFFQRKLVPNGYSLFSCGNHVILAEALFERVSVLAMEQGHPLGLLSQILEDGVVSLRQHPNRLLGVATREGQFGEGISLLRHRLRGATIVDDVQGRLALEAVVPKAEPVVQSFTRVDNIDLGVTPNPRTTLVGDVVLDGWTQDHYVPEDLAIGAFKEVKAEFRLAAPCLATNHGRMACAR